MDKPNQSGLIDGVLFDKDDPKTRLFIAANYWREKCVEKNAQIEALTPKPCCMEWRTCERPCAPLAANWREESQRLQREIEALRNNVFRECAQIAFDQTCDEPYPGICYRCGRCNM